MQVRRRLIDAWLHDLRVGWGDRAARSASTIAPALALGRCCDLHGIGHALAADGHPLDDVLAWFRLLAGRSRAIRQALAQGGIEHLAEGWADGVLHEEMGRSAVAPFEVLRLRVRQQMEHSRSLDEAPGQQLALVVIETDGTSGCTARAARHARDAFNAGETMAATTTGKLLVLVRRDHDVRRRTLHLTEALRLDDQFRSTPVRVWIEPLAMSAEHVDSHLLGLAS